MTNLRLALAQIDPTVGDLAGNADLVVEWTRRAAEADAGLVAFGEMVLTGYPVEDLVFRDPFVRASRDGLAALATRLADEGLGDLPAVVGYLDADGPVAAGSRAEGAGGPRNATAVLHRGRVVTTTFKHHLPNYGVFDEDRYFEPGDRLAIATVGGVDVALTICEDIWQDGGPVAVAGEVGVGLVLVVNGSPYERLKDDVRLDLCRRRAAEAGAALAYVNLVGGQDELVFDGDSLVVDRDGTLLARAPQFVEHLLVLDLDLPAAAGTACPERVGALRCERVEVTGPRPRPDSPVDPPRFEPLPDEAEVWGALVLGVRDYVGKNGFGAVCLGLSGGIDSAVCAAIAVDALGPDRVIGVSMPSRYSSGHSVDDAADLARRTGLDYRTTAIGSMVEAFESGVAGLTRLTSLAGENLQARCRGVVLMSLSNSEGPLVLTTGNKSELAVGYSTLYGDSAGGFNPIKDVPKSLVWKLARWRNADADKRGETPPIPENSIEKPPSAELAPGQKDTDSLPPYEQLDAILDDYVDGDLGRQALIDAGHDPAVVDRVVRLVDTAEYKRRQSAPGPKISLKAFGRDRRVPITSRWREH